MGLFDSVDVPHYCPKCNKKSSEYQTKDLAQHMQHYKVGESFLLHGMKVLEGEFGIYGICLNPKCHTKVEGKAYVRHGRLQKVTEFAEGLERVVAEYEQKQKQP